VRRALQFVFVSWLLSPGLVRAHAWSVSGMTLRASEARVQQQLELDLATLATLLHVDTNGSGAVEPSEAEASKPRVLTYVGEHVQVTTDRGPCRVGALQTYALTGERLRIVHALHCPAPYGALEVRNTAFQEDEGGHTFLGTFDVNGRASGHSFRAASTVTRIPVQGAADTSLLALVSLGVEHILGGLDHVLFVVSLVVVVASLRELVFVISAFTLAHSVTLSIGALELVRAPAAIVEPLIALTIAVVACENLWLATRRAPPGRAWILRYRPWLVFGFGLVHGFGFSGQLRELGLRSTSLAKALLAFNVGVELGQLLIVIPLFLLVRAIHRHDTARRALVVGASALILMLSITWLAERTGL
jgi:hypothetical protein